MAPRRALGLAMLLAAAGCAAPDDPGASSYAAFNLFTGAPRFGVFKADPDRDRCVRLVFLWSGGSGAAELDDALTTDAITVTDRAADCAGEPPSLEPVGVTADGATGTVTVTQAGDAWTVSVDGAATFGAATELVETPAIEIVGGCC